MSDRNYAETGWPDWTPTVSYVTADTAKRKAFRAFWRGSVFGAVLATGAFIASAAWSDSIQIGMTFINGEQFDGTTVTMEPSDVPGQLATVTLENQHVNQGGDTGTYTLTMDGLTVEVEFTWDAVPLTGADRITVIPPAGITCEPVDCGVTVMEGFTGQVILFDWVGS